jgi:hypothetical protein
MFLDSLTNKSWWKNLQAALVIVLCVLVTLLVIVNLIGIKTLLGLSENFQSEWNASLTGSAFGDPQGVARSLGAGGRMRHVAQFSQPNQGDRVTLYNADVVASAAALGKPAASTVKFGQEVSAAAQDANRAARAEYLVSDRYGPEFLESSSAELDRFQAMTPPIEYQVVDDATRGYMTGEASNSGYSEPSPGNAAGLVEYLDAATLRAINDPRFA